MTDKDSLAPTTKVQKQGLTLRVTSRVLLLLLLQCRSIPEQGVMPISFFVDVLVDSQPIDTSMKQRSAPQANGGSGWIDVYQFWHFDMLPWCLIARDNLSGLSK